MSKLAAVISAHWKALMPLVAFVASEVIAAASDVNAPHGWNALVFSAVSAVLVYLKSNNPAPTPPPADEGSVGVGVLLRVVAVVCLALFTAIGFDWITAEHGLGWLGAGLTLWLISSFAD